MKIDWEWCLGVGAIIWIIAALCFMSSCGSRTIEGIPGPTGTAAAPCTTKLVPIGVEIDCPDSPPVTVLNGAVGPQGEQGLAGLNGLDAAPCTTTQTASGATITCPGSPTVTVTDGTNGVNAAPITVVQLCPGTPSYPDTFVEVAICLNNNLYAVYSANDGFLTYLPPGEYSSDGIGASCSLTVQPNCVVEN